MILALCLMVASSSVSPAADAKPAVDAAAAAEPRRSSLSAAPAPAEAAAPNKAPTDAPAIGAPVTGPAELSVGLPVAASEVEDNAWGGYLRVSTIHPLDDRVEAFSTQGALSRAELGAVYRLDRRWSAELGFAFGTSSAPVYQALQLELGLYSLQAAASLRQPLWGPLQAVGRALASVDVGRMIVRDDRAVDASQSKLGFGGALTAGLAAELPLMDGALGLIVSAEGGYLVHGGFAFDALTREVAEGTEPARIPARALDAGAINPSGPLWRVGVSLVF